jgi:hypothetical protein
MSGASCGCKKKGINMTRKSIFQEIGNSLVARISACQLKFQQRAGDRGSIPRCRAFCPPGRVLCMYAHSNPSVFLLIFLEKRRIPLDCKNKIQNVRYSIV